jgi:hypothetical protein
MYDGPRLAREKWAARMIILLAGYHGDEEQKIGLAMRTRIGAS